MALIRRDDTHYLNEPYATGGNPVLAWQQPRTSNRNGDGKNIGGENGNDIFAASDRANAQAIATQLLFNDLLGSTIAVLDGKNVNNTDITLFGEMAGNAKSGNSPNGNGDSSNTNSEFSNNANNNLIDNSVFFTGKPHIAELGYSFLFRNYRSNYSKWQTADPLGYPDGWNNLAYCGNLTWAAIDKDGAVWSWAAAAIGAGVGAVIGVTSTAIVNLVVNQELPTAGQIAGAAVQGAIVGGTVAAAASAFTGDPSAMLIAGVYGGMIGGATGSIAGQAVQTEWDNGEVSIRPELVGLDAITGTISPMTGQIPRAIIRIPIETATETAIGATKTRILKIQKKTEE